MMDYSQHSDEALLHLVIQHEKRAFEELYDRYAQQTYNLVLRIVRAPDVAEEIVQESFWLVWKKAASYRGSGSVAAWLYRIARNRSLDMMRQQQAQVGVAPYAGHVDLDEVDALPQVGRLHSPVEQQITRLLDRAHVQRALAEIPVDQRHCLELAYFEGMSQRQIADYTRTPLGTVKTRLRMGLDKLKHILSAAGYQEDHIE